MSEQPNSSSSDWAMAVCFVALLVFLSFICTDGWGLIR